MKRLLFTILWFMAIGSTAHAASTNILLNLNSPTVPLSATTSGVNVAYPVRGSGVMITNLGAYPAWCASGVGSGTAAVASTGNGILIAPGAVIDAQIANSDTYIGCITTGGTSLLSISVVEGQ
jgi:hypothetical protein